MEKSLMTVNEVLGSVSISRTTLYAAIGRGDVRIKKIGRKTLVYLDSLKEWLGVDILEVYRPATASAPPAPMPAKVAPVVQALPIRLAPVSSEDMDLTGFRSALPTFDARQIVGMRRPLPCFSMSGIYFLINGCEIVYVGQAKNLWSRIATHIAEQKKEFDAATVIPYEEAVLDDAEAHYIRTFIPKYNAVLDGKVITNDANGYRGAVFEAGKHYPKDRRRIGQTRLRTAKY